MSYNYRPRLTKAESDMLYSLRNGHVVGIIGDTHEPFCLPDYKDFVEETFSRYNVDEVVHIGDIVDNHALSYHESDQNGYSAGHEYNMALQRMEGWYKTFPDAKVCIGNHDALPIRKAKTYGIPHGMLKTMGEIWNAPKGWIFDWTYDIDGVRYQHGTGFGGMYGHKRAAESNRQSTVIGHLHGVFGVEYMASEKDLIFGMAVGCGVDTNAYAFEYGKHFPRKPIIGCGIVIDGRIAIPVGMDKGKKYKWI